MYWSISASGLGAVLASILASTQVGEGCLSGRTTVSRIFLAIIDEADEPGVAGWYSGLKVIVIDSCVSAASLARLGATFIVCSICQRAESLPRFRLKSCGGDHFFAKRFVAAIVGLAVPLALDGQRRPNPEKNREQNA